MNDIKKSLGLVPGFMEALPKDVLMHDWRRSAFFEKKGDKPVWVIEFASTPSEGNQLVIVSGQFIHL